MDVKCPGCFAITTVFSHAQTVVLCGSCSTVLSQPTGGKARLTEGESFSSFKTYFSFITFQAAHSVERTKFSKLKLLSTKYIPLQRALAAIILSITFALLSVSANNALHSLTNSSDVKSTKEPCSCK